MYALICLALLALGDPEVQQTPEEATVLVALYESKYEESKLLERKAKETARHLAERATILTELRPAVPEKEIREAKYQATIAHLDHLIAGRTTIQSGYLRDYAVLLKKDGKPIPVPDDRGPE